MVLSLIPLWVLILDKLPKYLDLRKKEYELKKDDFFYSIDLDAKKTLLDDIIAEELQLYKIYNLGWMDNTDMYLNSKDQMKLIHELTYTVYTKRLTPAVISVLQYYYVINGETEDKRKESLQKIVLDRVSLAVLNLTIQTNSVTSIPL